MLKRGFILFFLVHLVGSYIVSAFTDELALKKQFYHSATTLLPGQESEFDLRLIEYFQALIAGFEGKKTDKASDNFSDEFRVRKFNYQFAPLLIVQARGFGLLTDFSIALKPFRPFLGGATPALPAYYQFLFRLTPF
jgi:hypothetical protein